jgi:hypothetical protein
MLVFCRVHVFRNFMKKYRAHDLTHHVRAIWDNAEDVTQLRSHMDSICEERPELKPWFKGKYASWVLAGLCKEASKVHPDWWTLARKDTNRAESSHHQDNFFTGHRNSLLGSILKCVYHLPLLHMLNIC